MYALGIVIQAVPVSKNAEVDDIFSRWRPLQSNTYIITRNDPNNLLNHFCCCWCCCLLLNISQQLAYLLTAHISYPLHHQDLLVYHCVLPKTTQLAFSSWEWPQSLLSLWKSVRKRIIWVWMPITQQCLMALASMTSYRVGNSSPRGYHWYCVLHCGWKIQGNLPHCYHGDGGLLPFDGSGYNVMHTMQHGQMSGLPSVLKGGSVLVLLEAHEVHL